MNYFFLHKKHNFNDKTVFLKLFSTQTPIDCYTLQEYVNFSGIGYLVVLGNIVALLHSILFALNWVAIKKEVAFLDKNLFTACVCTSQGNNNKNAEHTI